MTMTMVYEQTKHFSTRQGDADYFTHDGDGKQVDESGMTLITHDEGYEF